MATESGASWVASGEALRGAANDGAPTLLTDTTLTSVSPAPATGQKLMIDDIIVGVDAACYVKILEETSGTLLCSRIYFAAAGFQAIRPRNGLRTFTAGKKVQAQLSTTANCSILVNCHSLGGPST